MGTRAGKRYQLWISEPLAQRAMEIAEVYGLRETSGRASGKATLRTLIHAIGEGQIVVMKPRDVRLMLDEIGVEDMAEFYGRADVRARIARMEAGENEIAEMIERVRRDLP